MHAVCLYQCSLHSFFDGHHNLKVKHCMDMHSKAARRSSCSPFQQDLALAAALHGLLHCCLDILQVVLCPCT